MRFVKQAVFDHVSVSYKFPSYVKYIQYIHPIKPLIFRILGFFSFPIFSGKSPQKRMTPNFSKLSCHDQPILDPIYIR